MYENLLQELVYSVNVTRVCTVPKKKVKHPTKSKENINFLLTN